MKKILSLLVAMLMVFGMAAVAETAAATGELVSMGNFVVRFYDEAGNATEVPLEDLIYCVGIDAAADLNFVLELGQGEDTLAFALARLAGNKLQASLSNVERAFEFELPEVAGLDYATLADAIRADIARGIESGMGMIPAPALPKLDATALLGGFVTETAQTEGVSVSHYVIPAEQVAMVLQMVNELAKAYGESVPQASGVLELVDQIVQNGVSFQISGDIADSGDAQAVTFEIYMASGDQVEETPSVTLTATSMENGFALGVDLPNAGTVATLGLDTDPAANTMSFFAEIANFGNLVLTFDQENDLQNINLAVEGMGKSAAAQFSYGDVDGQDYIAFNAAADGVGSFSVTSNGAKEDDATYLGNMDCEMTVEDYRMGVAYDFAVTLEDLGLADIEMPAEVSSDEPTDEEMQAFMQPVIDYFTAIFAIEEPAA